jgi:small subunit ribosomal protein S20
MPILKNAKKALRVSARKAELNNVVRSKMRTLVKKAQVKPSVETLGSAFSSIDKAVKNHLIHANKAARLKSQLSKISAK